MGAGEARGTGPVLQQTAAVFGALSLGLCAVWLLALRLDDDGNLKDVGQLFLMAVTGLAAALSGVLATGLLLVVLARRERLRLATCLTALPSAALVGWAAVELLR